MLPLNLLQTKGLFTFISSLTLGLSPLAEPILNAPESVTPPAVVEQLILDVPFTSQAPEGNWKQPWQDACEETSILMVDRFYQEQAQIGLEEAKKAIVNILNIDRKSVV